MRVRRSTEELEDVSGQAGWMYTDLLLGLMVIFLATISFVPQNRAYLETDIVQIYTREHPTKLATSYTDFNLGRIKQDLMDFTAREGINGKMIIPRVQIIGSYNPNNETPQDGITRAMNFHNRIDSEDPSFLKSTAITLKSSPDSDVRKFVIEFSLAVEIQVLPEGFMR